MISDFKKKLDRMDKTLQRERERQQALLNYKLAEKRNKLNDFKQHQAH